MVPHQFFFTLQITLFQPFRFALFTRKVHAAGEIKKRSLTHFVVPHQFLVA